MTTSHLDRITTDPKVMVGKPVVKGTRIPVELILRMLAQGIHEQEILQDYPRLAPGFRVRGSGGCSRRGLSDRSN